jgi:hypothetical protein
MNVLKEDCRARCAGCDIEIRALTLILCVYISNTYVLCEPLFGRYVTPLSRCDSAEGEIKVISGKWAQTAFRIPVTHPQEAREVVPHRQD